MVLYDLPVMTAGQRRAAHQFRKLLTERGFLPVQKSVYVKLLRNESNAAAEIAQIKKAAPKDGTVNALTMSLCVFQGLQSLCGTAFQQALFANDVMVI